MCCKPTTTLPIAASPIRSAPAGRLLAFCWAHRGRQWFDLAKSPAAPIAAEALKRIAELYEIEAEIPRSAATAPKSAAALRQEKTKPLVAALNTWLEKTLVQVASG
jgi:hypothetical protein